MSKFYITTAIAYTSSKPHIGNTYEVILADAIARYHRLKGEEVYFQTGTDEHGEKIELKAKESGLTPQEFVNNVAGEVQNIWDMMNTSYDKFVRTTDVNHKKIVADIFKKLYEQDDIYKGEYKGLYCVPCESFWTTTQLIDGKCPDCGGKVHEQKEEAYFFRLSKYQDKLIQHIKKYPNFIKPEARKNEMLNNFLKPGLQDLCVSRSSFKWGVPVNFDDKHVVYVWIDALSNYITNIGYDILRPKEEFNKWWPADLQIVGKDIIRFHVIYWPIILMALNLPLPKQVFGHPWLLFGQEKMSKSKGNILYADDLVKKYGVDVIRFYCLHEIPYKEDGTITNALITECNNSNLANNLGNLVNRTISMGHKYFNGTISNSKIKDEIDENLINNVLNLKEIVDEKMLNLHVGDALEEIFIVLSKCNKYIDETAPWLLAKDETKKERLETVLYNLLESIRICAVLLSCFMPDTSNKIFNQLNTVKTQYNTINEFGMEKEYKLNKPEILFNRIEETK